MHVGTCYGIKGSGKLLCMLHIFTNWIWIGYACVGTCYDVQGYDTGGCRILVKSQ
jgi:hypothetical protein